MSEQLPSIADFRSMVIRGQSAVLAELRVRPDDEKIKAALSQYDRIFGTLDSLTKEERLSPVSLIDSGRIRRIAHGAGVTDQEVIQLLFNYQQYCELILRSIAMQRRDCA
ncbi:MAG: Signal peptide binding domain [Schlesneria sp.]|nr:Signal peptide binding domain [Schlesneria sp.]